MTCDGAGFCRWVGQKPAPMGMARARRPKNLRAGSFRVAINSFGLHLNAEGKSLRTVRIRTEAVRWCAALSPSAVTVRRSCVDAGR